MQAESEIDRQAVLRPSSTPPRTSWRHHAVNIGLIALALTALFWRVFFLGETLIDVNTLNNQLPWGYSAGQSDYPYNRRDLTDTYVTREYFVASAYRDGEFPLWNPYTMAGHPIYADGVTRTLSPFLLFYKFFDVPLGYSLARITELLLAAVFIYVFLVVIGASASGALTGSLVFGFSSHSMLHLTGLGWWGGFLWLPLILLSVDRAVKDRGASAFRWAMLAGVFLGAQFFCGYLPNQIYYLGAVVLYYLFFGRWSEARSIWQVLGLMALTVGIGLALAATQWVPSLELLSNSNRKIVGADLGFVWLPPWYAATLVFPNLFGSAYDAKMLTLFTALGVSHDHILYLGIATLVPTGFSLYWLKQRRKTRRRGEVEPQGQQRNERERYIIFFAGLATFSLLVMMAAPLYVPVTRYIPVLQVIRVAVRAGVLFLFAASVLAALGTDLLARANEDALSRFAKAWRRFLVGVAGCVALAVIASYSMKFAGFAADTTERGRLAFIRRAALALGAQFQPPRLDIMIPLILLLAAALLLWLFERKRLRSIGFLACLVGLLMIDLFWNSAQFDHTFDRSHVFPRTQITDLLRSLPPGRVLIVPSGLETNRHANEQSPEKIIAPPNTLLPYQISTVTGKNQQFPKWYREFASLIEPQPNLSHVVFDTPRSPFFDLLNVRYVLTHDSMSAAGYDLLATAEGVSLYENKSAMPRAFFVPRIIDVSSHDEAIKLLREAHIEPRSIAVIEGAGATFAAVIQSADEMDQTRRGSRAELLKTFSSGTARIVDDKRNRVVIETDNESADALVLSDNYYPGWRAFVDGSPVEILRANCTMRAVSVPAGRHVVSFEFAPKTFFVSMWISLATAGLTLVAMAGAAKKRLRALAP